MKIAVLTINFNSSERTAKLVDSLKNSTHRDYFVYVVDNGSEKENYNLLKKLLKKHEKKVKIIRSEKNLGWGLGCNIGFKEILKKKIPYTFVVNNDSKLDRNCLKSCLEVMERDKKIGICGVKSLNDDGSIQTTGGIIKPLSKITGIMSQNKKRIKEKKVVYLDDREFVDDCAWMIRTRSEEDIIWYPDYLFMYFEEIYINKEMRKKGKKIAYNPKAFTYHTGYGSSGAKTNAIPVFYLTRNRFIFMKDYYPQYFIIFFLVYSLIIFPVTFLKYLIKYGWNIAKYLPLGYWSATVFLLTRRKLYLMKKDGKLGIFRS